MTNDRREYDGETPADHECPKCHDTGHIRDSNEYEGFRYCSCAEGRKQEREG